MIFYLIIDKKTQDMKEVNKVFFSGIDAQHFADNLNYQFAPEKFYIPYPFLHIPTKEEKEMYSGVIKRRRFIRKQYQENKSLH